MFASRRFSLKLIKKLFGSRKDFVQILKELE